MTNEKRRGLIRAYLAVHLIETEFSNKDIRDILGRVNVIN